MNIHFDQDGRPHDGRWGGRERTRTTGDCTGMGTGAWYPPSRSSLSSLLASRLSLFSCFSISWLMRFCSFASSLRQHAMVQDGRASAAPVEKRRAALGAGYAALILTPGLQPADGRTSSTEDDADSAQITMANPSARGRRRHGWRLSGCGE